jgi:hypothetical protein
MSLSVVDAGHHTFSAGVRTQSNRPALLIGDPALRVFASCARSLASVGSVAITGLVGAVRSEVR